MDGCREKTENEHWKTEEEWRQRDLMMRVLSGPRSNGFSPAVCVYVSEVD